MDGQQLWKAFLDAKIPGGDLKELGYDLFWVRAHPHTTESKRAVSALGSIIGITGDHAYHALNIEPGRAVLQQLADDYRNGRFWANLAPSTGYYINNVARRVNIIKNAASQRQPPAAPGTPGASPKAAGAAGVAAAAAKAAPSAGPSPSAAPSAAPSAKRVSTYVAIAFSVLALNELVKAALYRWQQKLVNAH